ncbi:MAG: TlyA family RNA methyltransferase [Rhodomicrobium sp.]
MRIDHLLVRRGLVRTRSQAQDLIRRGAVSIGGKIAAKPGIEISEHASVQLLENTHYVSRGSWKLIAALDAFGFSPEGKTCLDLGASTGGFTQVLLERGASRVFAVDVGRDQLDPSLRADLRVISMESTDARSLRPDLFDSPIRALTCDVSFISLSKVLPAVLPLAAKGAWLVALIKPQFEVGPALVGKGGIVKDVAARHEAVQRAVAGIKAGGWRVRGTIPSPLPGQDGNEETLAGATWEG